MLTNKEKNITTVKYFTVYKVKATILVCLQLGLRFFLCNLQCNGFGQIDPTDPEKYELPFEDFDVSSVDRVEDLPVWDKGCDSSYTWAKKFKELMGQETPSVLANKLVDIMKNDSNPEGLFLHPVTKQRQHLCITGGEPLMITGQRATIGIYEELKETKQLARINDI